MKKLTNEDVRNPLWEEALYNVIQRGVRSIRNQDDGKTEGKIPELKNQRILMQKLEYAILYNRVEIKVILK